MLEGIDHSTIVGTKQVLRAVLQDQLAYVYLAEDVDAFLAVKLRAACEEHQVEVKTITTMKELGVACNIDVGAACAGVRR